MRNSEHCKDPVLPKSQMWKQVYAQGLKNGQGGEK